MLQLSYWAKAHRWPSRFIIAGLYIILNLSGWLIGNLLFDTGYVLPAFIFNFLFVAALLLMITYPAKDKKFPSALHKYRYRKAYHLLLATTSFLLIVSTVNNNYLGSNATVAKAVYVPERNTPAEIIPEKPKSRIFKKSWKQLIKAIRLKQGRTSTFVKVLLILLALVVATAALYGIAALSCSLACSGADVLAVIVAVSGSFLIIFFLVRIIRRIIRGKGRMER
jgi:hypothetical protein